MFSSITNIPSTTSILSVYTSFSASAMLFRTVINEVQSVTNQIFPKKFQDTIFSKLGFLVGNLSSEMTIIVDEYNGYALNQMFEAADIYLRTKQSPSVEKLKVYKTARDEKFTVAINKGEKIVDSSFQGMDFIWTLVSLESQKPIFDYDGGSISTENVERRSFQLSFNKNFKDTALNSYLPYVLEKSKSIQEQDRKVKIYSLGNLSGEYEGVWGSVNLEHPSTFDTLAMDPEVKKNLLDDLDRFVKRRDFYKRVGKAWKRGYLLYGPPGTGKSSLIAAMANYLKFDIYDLELSSLQRNSELRNLLVSTKNRSILVIEDIDCTIDLENREAGGHDVHDHMQITLSGLLNFIDGLWSSCGDERIIIFTTNYKDKLDPALLRPGRMDMHIHMSYCTPSGFKILASRYLGQQEINKYNCTKFTDEIEELIAQVKVTPAEVAEQLMISDDPQTALLGLIAFLETVKEKEKQKERVGEEAKVGEGEEETMKKGEEVEGRVEKKIRRSKRKRGRKCRI